MVIEYLNSDITGILNSFSQCELILAQAAELGLKNVQVIMADVNGPEPPWFLMIA